MASIRQRGKRFQARVIRRGEEPLAKSFKTYEEAERWASAMETVIALRGRGEAPKLAREPRAATPRRPVRRLGDLAQDWYSVEGSKMRDARNNESRIRKLFGETVDPRTQKPDHRYGLSRDMYVHELSNAVLAKLKAKRVAEGNTLKTWNREASLVQSLLRFAKASGVRLPEELTVSELKAREKRQQGRLRWYTLAEEAHLLQELNPKRPIQYQPEWDKRSAWLKRTLQDQYDLAVFLLDTGGRYGEGAEVPWDCVDLGRGTINLYRDKVGNEGELRMTARLHEVLGRRWNERDAATPYIFAAGITGPEGEQKAKAAPRGYAVKGLRNAMERAGLNAAHLVARFGRATPAHTLRHTFASRLVQAGMSLQKVAYLLGHADVSTTQIYAHLVPNETASEAAAILDRLAQRAEVVNLADWRTAK